MSCLYSTFYVMKRGNINSFDIKSFPIDEEVRAMKPHLKSADINITYEVGRFINFKQLDNFIKKMGKDFCSDGKFFLDQDDCERIFILLYKINKDNAMEILPPSNEGAKEVYDEQFFKNVEKAIEVFEKLYTVASIGKGWWVFYEGINI